MHTWIAGLAENYHKILAKFSVSLTSTLVTYFNSIGTFTG